MKIILVVDRDESARRTLCAYASRLGHGSLEASDCREAMRIVSETQVDLIVIDLAISDFAQCGIIDQYVRNSGGAIPVLLCSSAVESAGEVEFMYAKASFAYMSKPVSFDTFIRRTEKLLAPPPPVEKSRV